MGIPSKVIVFFFYILVIVLSVITLIFSFSQVTDKIVNINMIDGGCSGGLVPYKAASVVDGKTVGYWECSWKLNRSFVRCLIQFLNILTIGALFLCFLKKKRAVYMLISIFLMGLGGFGVYSFLSDSSSLSSAHTYCNSDSVQVFTGTKECSFSAFYGTLAFNVITSLVVCGVSILSFLKRGKLFDDHHHSTDSSSTSPTGETSLLKNDGNRIESYSSI